MRDTLFLVNPRAGSGRASRVWEAALATYPGTADAAVIASAQPELSIRVLDEWLQNGGSRLIVIGGDGSIHLALNRLFHSGRQSEVALGLVPAGTGSDLARTLGIPSDPRAALARALNGSQRMVDVLAVRGEGSAGGSCRYVMNVASIGISGLVAERVNAQAKRRPTTYLTSTLRALCTYTSFACKIEADGESWYEGEVFLLAFANGRAFGKGMKIAPRADVADGLADVVLIRPMPRWQIPLRMPRVFLGTHLEKPHVIWRRARQVRFEPAGPLPPFEVDGELIPSGPAVFEVLPGALRFLG
ncbi:MAG TPA: diacylglycerol kinase family protein [Thermoanaerobaculia bacterium]|nr:diacylglycerol kinase family protein [Thermoanaerobaculia bacterium]